MDKDKYIWKQRNEILHKKVNRQMEEIKDLHKHETIFDLARRFPNKTYRELEKYRDADRQEEAQQIITQQENEELKEDQLTESQQKQKELEPIQEDRTIFEEERKKFQDYKAMYEKEQAQSGYPQSELDRIKRENNDLHNKVTALLDAVNPEKNLKKARESGL